MKSRALGRAQTTFLAAVLSLTLTGAVIALGSCKKGQAPRGSHSVTFRTQDGFVLEGTLFGSGSDAVVLAHMFPADQSSWFDFARQLADHGYLALSFNFRGYGKSQGEKDIGVIDRDVRAAIEFVRSRKAVTGVALVGASMGGTASVIAASTEKVDGVVTLSAPVEFMGLNATQAVGRVTAPKYFIASTGDKAAAETAGRLYRGSAPPREIEIIPGDRHGTNILKGPKGEELATKIIAFLEKGFSGATS